MAPETKLSNYDHLRFVEITNYSGIIMALWYQMSTYNYSYHNICIIIGSRLFLPQCWAQLSEVKLETDDETTDFFHGDAILVFSIVHRSMGISGRLTPKINCLIVMLYMLDLICQSGNQTYTQGGSWVSKKRGHTQIGMVNLHVRRYKGGNVSLYLPMSTMTYINTSTRSSINKESISWLPAAFS